MIDRWMNTGVDERTGGQIDGWMDGCMNRWMDGQMGKEWIDGKIEDRNKNKKSNTAFMINCVLH